MKLSNLLYIIGLLLITFGAGVFLNRNDKEYIPVPMEITKTKTDTVTIEKIIYIRADHNVKPILADTAKCIIAVDSTIKVDSGFIRISSDDIVAKGIDVSYKLPVKEKERTIVDSVFIKETVFEKKPFYDTFPIGFLTGIVAVGAVVIAAL